MGFWVYHINQLQACPYLCPFTVLSTPNFDYLCFFPYLYVNIEFPELWSWIPEILTSDEFCYHPGILHRSLKIGHKGFCLFGLVYVHLIFRIVVFLEDCVSQA